MGRFTRMISALAALAILLALMPAVARALPDEGGFILAGFDVAVDVSRDNVYAVAETIAVNFTEPRHGIYRDIPLMGPVRRGAGNEGFYRASIEDIAVEGVPFEISNHGDMASIRIGSADEAMEGRQVYRVYYKLRFADDGEPGFDEVYLNLVGNGWNTSIAQATFSVSLPDAFDSGAVGFLQGQNSAEVSTVSSLEYAVEGSNIKGKTLRPLSPGEGLTLRVELPQGYFTPATAPGPEAAPPEVPQPAVDQPAEGFVEGPQPDFGSTVGVGAPLLLLGGGAVVMFGLFAVAAVIVIAIVLASRRSGGIGRPRSGLAQDELWRRQQMDQMNHMNQMHNMNHTNHTHNNTGGGHNTGGGGSW